MGIKFTIPLCKLYASATTFAALKSQIKDNIHPSRDTQQRACEQGSITKVIYFQPVIGPGPDWQLASQAVSCSNYVTNTVCMLKTIYPMTYNNLSIDFLTKTK